MAICFGLNGWQTRELAMKLSYFTSYVQRLMECQACGFLTRFHGHELRSIDQAYQVEVSFLVQSLWWRHRSLDGQASNVLPSLLQQGDEVVDGQHDVTNQLILSHLNVADSDTQAENLLQLELDGGLDFGDLGTQIFVVGDWSWEFTSLGKTGTQETRNLLDQGVGGKESIVLAGELFDELLVLVKLLQVVGRHGVKIGRAHV